jgi:hypothetical protein
MPLFSAKPATAFSGVRRLASGPLNEVALAAKAARDEDPAAAILIFDDQSGRVVDVDLRGDAADVAARLAERSGELIRSLGREREALADRTANGAETAGRGRPKLGVVAREVTLLPRHWEWLAAQPGGASATLRRLVEDARRDPGGARKARAARDAAYSFLSALAGDFIGFEEAARALFADDRERFDAHARTWPGDVRDYAKRLAWGGGR